MAVTATSLKAIFTWLNPKKLVTIIVFSLGVHCHLTETNDENDHSTKPDLKRILIWNQKPPYELGAGQTAFTASGCNIDACELFDRQYGDVVIPDEDFDAILFLPISETAFIQGPARRNPTQRYVFVQQESPSYHVLNLEHYSNFFNWTATYRQDSDLQFPRGCINEISLSVQGVLDCKREWMEPIFFNATVDVVDNRKLIARFASNCATESKRELYVQELEHYINIDTYGPCGMHRCGYSVLECEEFVQTNYKFYLSFESSLCNDYATEKFFRMLNIGIVPVVYGGADYKKIAPPHSYIDVRDFESPKELANYLLYLDLFPGEYEKYLWWKLYYEYQDGVKVFVCHLCEKLNHPYQPKKVYKDINEWWTKDQCHSYYQHFVQADSYWVIGDKARYFNLLSTFF